MKSHLNAFTTRLATFLVLHVAGAGQASPTVLVTRPAPRMIEWLPTDNQTYYSLREGEKRMLELNTTSLEGQLVFITISPCTRNFHWSIYYCSVKEHLTLIKEQTGIDMAVVSILVKPETRYLMQLSSTRGGSAVVSARGEPSRPVRMRLRVRSRRRLAANWEPSPIDPQSTTYCVVASHRTNYTSLCAAQFDMKTNRLYRPNRYNLDRFDNDTRIESVEVDNKIDSEYNSYEMAQRNVFRRKKFGEWIKPMALPTTCRDLRGLRTIKPLDNEATKIHEHTKITGRSTKATDGDPVIACVGERTHHVIENLDSSMTYYVSVFGVAKDRRAGSLLASGSVKARTSTAKRLRENVPYRSEIKSKTVYYFKTTLGSGGGLWMTVSTCGGAVDVEVLVRGKRLYLAKNVEPHSKFFVPVPMSSSVQETSDEGSVQFDSSSEEMKMRYVVKVMPCRSDRDGNVGIEITASTTRWGGNTPELQEDGAIVRELRPKRSCTSVDIAFLPATHNATNVIRYCITARENISDGNYLCTTRSTAKVQCMTHLQKPTARVIVQKINGLSPGKKYAIQVTASNNGNTVPYMVLYADTNLSCKDE